MRPIHWTKIPGPKLTETFWAKYVEGGDLELEYDVLEAWFGIKDATKKKKKEKKEIKTLLDAKRSQNLGIFLSGFKMSPEDVQLALRMVPPNDAAMGLDHAIAVRKLAPTQEEAQAYAKFKGDHNALASEDKFLMSLMEIPFLNQRLDLARWVHEFPAQYDDLAPEVIRCADVCDELLGSGRLEKVLVFALSIGNYINSSSGRPGVDGVPLRFFSKFNDFGGAIQISEEKTRKVSLMDFLIYTLSNQKDEDKKLLYFDEDIETVLSDEQPNTQALAAECDIISRDLTRATKRIDALKDKLIDADIYDDIDEAYFIDLENMIVSYEERLDDLRDMMQDVSEAFTEVVQKFGESPKKKSEELFAETAEFVRLFKAARDEFFRKQEQQRKKRAKKKKLMEMAAAKQAAITDGEGEMILGLAPEPGAAPAESEVPRPPRPSTSPDRLRANAAVVVAPDKVAAPDIAAPAQVTSPPTMCGFVSTRGKCSAMTMKGFQNCHRHACPTPGCGKGKPSADDTCGACPTAPEKPAAYFVVTPFGADDEPEPVSPAAKMPESNPFSFPEMSASPTRRATSVNTSIGRSKSGLPTEAMDGTANPFASLSSVPSLNVPQKPVQRGGSVSAINPFVQTTPAELSNTLASLVVSGVPDFVPPPS